MRRFKENFPILSRILIAILILAILFLLAWGAWALAYNQGWVQRAPTLNFASLANPIETREQQPNQPAVEPTAPPARVDPTAPPPREEPTAPPAQPTVPPATPEPIYTENIVYVTPEPEQPVQPVIAYSEKTISFKVGKDKQKMKTFTYSGGWVPKKDPWFVAIMDSLDKEVPEAYGVSIAGDLWPDKIQNFLIATCADPWSLTWFRFQLGLESFDNMDEANDRAWQLIEMKPEDYDKVVNETLTYFFKKLNGGHIETSEDWNLEVMLRFTPDTDDDDEEDGIDPELFAREYSDTNHKPDLLVTFFAKGQKKTFVSNKKALEVAAAAAKVNSGNYSNRVWFNFTEGGTPKWKSNGKNNPPPGETTPPPTPTPTPTTPPTPTPRPTKDPSQRPTESDAPVGGGPTNPENSTDPHTTDHVESTPAPAVTDPPPVTNPPTAVPTAEVRPTEVCETDAPTPIREDTNTPPPSSPGHNVPQTETEGQGGTDFDPGSI